MSEHGLPNPPPTEADLLTTERLTVPQRRFLDHFAGTTFRRRFYLSGGAALSSGYLAHRFSDDLDFFGPDPVPIKRLVPFMEQLPGLEHVLGGEAEGAPVDGQRVPTPALLEHRHRLAGVHVLRAGSGDNHTHM